MGNSQHAYFFFPYQEYERVREAFEESPPNLECRIGILKPRERSGAICEERKDRVDFGRGGRGPDLASDLLARKPFCQFVRDFWREPDWSHSPVR
jgi:hypothetical protein